MPHIFVCGTDKATPNMKVCLGQAVLKITPMSGPFSARDLEMRKGLETEM